MRGKKRPDRERHAALAIAVVDGAESASQRSGIPERTIRSWMERPEFAELRAKTRDDLAEGFRTLAHLAMTQLMEAIQRGDVDPRDLALTLGIATDKHQLLSGQATSRAETKDLTSDLNDHERDALRKAIDAALGDPSGAPAPDPGDAAVEEPSQT